MISGMKLKPKKVSCKVVSSSYKYCMRSNINFIAEEVGE